MAKSKKLPKTEAATDATEPAETFMLRLPMKYREGLQDIRKRTGKQMTTSVQIALEKYFRENGVDFVPNWPEAL